MIKKRGFTILETIVAISVLSLVVAGVFSALGTGLAASINTKDEIRAFYFAQEAIEALRQKRDKNKIMSASFPFTHWLSGVANLSTDPCYSGTPPLYLDRKTCTVDGSASGLTLSTCMGGWGSCPFLRQDSTTFAYGYNAAWPAITKYKREIQIEKLTADEARVTIYVKWSRGSNNYEIKIGTLLFNWQ